MTPAEERFEALAQQHGQRVLAYLARRTTPAEDAADLYQHVLTTAWRKIHAVPEGDEAALCWMLAVARRELANHRRAATRRLAATDRLRAAIALGQPANSHTDHDSSVSGVDSALARLSESERELITLTYWDGLTSDEVARVVGATPVATRKRLQRARAKIATMLQEGGEGAVDNSARVSVASGTVSAWPHRSS